MTSLLISDHYYYWRVLAVSGRSARGARLRKRSAVKITGVTQKAAGMEERRTDDECREPRARARARSTRTRAELDETPWQRATWDGKTGGLISPQDMQVVAERRRRAWSATLD